MAIDFSTLPPEVASAIPEDVSGHTSIQRYNDLPSLLKGHIEAESYRGRSIALPNGESKPEELDKWAGEQSAKLKERGYAISKLGELPPADPKEYAFKIDGLDEKALAEDKGVNLFRTFAHKRGLSNSQANGLVEDFIKEMAPQLKGAAEPEPEYITGDAAMALVDKAFPGQTEATIENYIRSINHLKVTNPELPDILNDSVTNYEGKIITLGDHPAVIKLINAIAEVTQQDFGGNMSGSPVVTKEGAAAAQEAEDIIRNKQNPKHEIYWQGDKATHEYVQGLYKKAYPGDTQI